MKITSKINLNWFKILIIIVVLIGTIFRFLNLDSKVYWGDETVTSLRISGHNLIELQNLAYTGKPLTIQEIKEYQYPNQDKNVFHTILGLAQEEPQHPPIYFVLARCWVQIFGDSVAVTRSFSAVISLLAFPCIYWLCWELFQMHLPGTIAVALIAVSPFHILYAQEARSYSFWTLTILLSSAALLRAIRLNTKQSWWVYTLSMILGLYTFIMSIIMAISHSIYVIWMEQFRWNQNLKSYFLALRKAIIAFIPWLIAVLIGISTANDTTSWTSNKVSLIALIKTWMLNFSRIFFDFNHNLVYRHIFVYSLIFAFLFLIVFAFYNLIKSTEIKVWLFVLSLISITFLVLAIPDLILGGRRSGVARYLIPCYLGIQITLAYFLSNLITNINRKIWLQKLGQVLTLAVLTVAIFSNLISFQASSWWNKYTDIYYPELATIINATSQPLVVTGWHSLMSFSHIFNPNVKLLSASRIVEPRISKKLSENKFIPSKIPDGYSDIFVYNLRNIEELLTENPQYRITETYEWKQQIEPVYETKVKLWKLVKK